jgi:hypothetical protein
MVVIGFVAAALLLAVVDVVVDRRVHAHGDARHDADDAHGDADDTARAGRAGARA